MIKRVAFSFGRFQPLTIGHGLLINGLQNMAKAGNANHYLFLSQSQNNKTDPLPWKLKKRVVKSAFSVNVYEGQDVRTPFEALKMLSSEYKEIVFIVGSDRVDEFTQRMTPYAKKWGIEKFIVLSAGQRDPDALDATGMSGTKLRELAKKGKEKEFYKGLPNQLNSVMKTQVYQYTIKGLEYARIRNSTVKRAKG